MKHKALYIGVVVRHVRGHVCFVENKQIFPYVI